MKQLLYGLSLTALLGVTSIVSLPETISAQTNRQCSAAISRAKAKIRAVRNTSVRVEKDDISRSYNDFPAGRPLAYAFLIKGEGRYTVLNSTKFLTQISQNIINNCQFVSLVVFAWDNTGDPGANFGLMPDGKVKLFECTSRENVGWGYVSTPEC